MQRCRERSTGREFAAKFIATSEARDREDADHEVDIMLRLRHCRRLVQLYDVFDMKNHVCLVLEMYVAWLNGSVVSTLGMRIRRPRFDSRVAPLFDWVATLVKVKVKVGYLL